MASGIEVSSRDGVMEIRFARPANMNALTADMYGAAAEAITAFNRSADLRAVIFTGEGKHFCAGNDLEEFLTTYSLASGSAWRRFLEELAGIRKPVMAAVQGRAVGIGMTMLLHCDFVYAEPDALLSAPFVGLGLCPEAASSLLLPARIGHLRAMEVFALGRELDAATALQWNLVTAVTESEASRDVAIATAARLARLNAGALLQTKKLAGHNHAAIQDQIDRECGVFMDLLRGEETRSGLRSLLERRRKPKPE